MKPRIDTKTASRDEFEEAYQYELDYSQQCLELNQELVNRNNELFTLLTDYRLSLKHLLNLDDSLKITDQDLLKALQKHVHTLNYNYQVALAGLRREKIHVNRLAQMPLL